jgi:PIN domain
LKVLLGTDVLMDVALGTPEFGPNSRRVVEWCQQRPESAIVAWHTMSNLFYLLTAARSVAFSRSFLADLLSFVFVASGGTEQLRQALNMHMRDFEDALQLVAAIAGKADFIITRNIADYRSSVVSALRPDEFLNRFSPHE